MIIYGICLKRKRIRRFAPVHSSAAEHSIAARTCKNKDLCSTRWTHRLDDIEAQDLQPNGPTVRSFTRKICKKKTWKLKFSETSGNLHVFNA